MTSYFIIAGENELLGDSGVSQEDELEPSNVCILEGSHFLILVGKLD